jgi:dCMP deaminase
MNLNTEGEICFHKTPSEDFFNLTQNLTIGSWIAKPGEGIVYSSTDVNLFDDDETIYKRKDKKMDLIYLKMAEVWGSNSYCKRMQVGSLIVKDKSIISDGYNGSPTGFPNNCEDDEFVTLNYVLHAEANAITKLAKSTQSSENSTLYVTVSPCFECSKLIIQAGIKRVVFSEVYRKPESIKFLFDAGIEIIRIEKKGN